MNDSTLVMHAARVAHGIAAAATCAAVFYLAGLLITLPTRRFGTDALAPALIGAALFVVLCWFGVERGVSVSQMALAFGGVTVLGGAVGYRWVRARFVDPVSARRSFMVFAALYILAYLFTLPPATSNQLPVAWTGNVDLMTYARYTRYFLQLGPSNLTEFTYFNFVYLQTPGLFYLLGAFSLLFNQDPLAAAMPAQFAFVAFTGTMVAAISRSIFNLSSRAGFAIACIFITGPFFRYVAANYFLSTLMAMPLLLYLLLTALREHSGRLIDVSLAIRLGAVYILLLFIYPFLLFAGIGLQAGAIVLRLMAQLQTRGEQSTRHVSLVSASSTLLTVAAACAVVALAFWSRIGWSVDMVLLLSEKGVAGWPLGFISPQAIFAWPGIRSSAMQVAPASERFAFLAFVGIACALICAYYWWFRSRTSAEQSALAGLLAFVVLLYCVYFAIEGRSYQQWKFASYSVLPLSFVLMAAVAQALNSSALFARFAQAPSDRRLLRAFPVFIALAFIGGNAAAHAAYDPSLRRLPGSLRRIADIDELSSFREVTVRMSDTPDGLATWVALYYLPNKKVHVVSSRFSPSEPLALELVSRQRPLLMHNFGCEGIGHDGTMTVEGVGCLVFAPPSPELGVTYPFNRTYLFMPYEGMTGRSSDGRWNSRPKVPLTVLIDPERTEINGPAYLNVSVRPKDSTGPLKLGFQWSADKHAEASIAAEEWLSVPISISDWTGNRLWALTVQIDVPAVETLLFRELSITDVPRGRVLGRK